MSRKKEPQIGWVYLLSNPALQGMVKIGFSSKRPEVRAKELSKSTSIPLDFEVEDEWWVEAPAQYERLIHAKLIAERVNENKEFFSMSVSDAEDVINNVVYGLAPGVIDVDVIWRHQYKMMLNHPDKTRLFHRLLGSENHKGHLGDLIKDGKLLQFMRLLEKLDKDPAGLLQEIEDFEKR